MIFPFGCVRLPEMDRMKNHRLKYFFNSKRLKLARRERGRFLSFFEPEQVKKDGRNRKGTFSFTILKELAII